MMKSKLVLMAERHVKTDDVEPDTALNLEEHVNRQ
jgi:hypothetical protein